MYNLAKFLENINSRIASFRGAYRFNEPMAQHTSIKTGGSAELWIKPEGECFPDYSAVLLESARNEGIPVFILGGGANIVVSDKGIQGIVLDTGGYSGEIKRDDLTFRAGTPIDHAVEHAARQGLSGLEFLAGMPGSIGGALWMNARCYDREMADVVRDVNILENGKIQHVTPRRDQFGYKKSPFQGMDALILGVSFAMQEKDPVLIKKEMTEHRNDREVKGHYRLPSAGSVFKNSRIIGKPTGKIIDELGMKGLSIGDAQIAPWHGNFIVNRGNARTEDILSLVRLIEERAKTELGMELEREILFIGIE